MNKFILLFLPFSIIYLINAKKYHSGLNHHLRQDNNNNSSFKMKNLVKSDKSRKLRWEENKIYLHIIGNSYTCNRVDNCTDDIKDKLLKKNYRFLSETDSEVIVNLIDYYYNVEKIDFFKTLSIIKNELQGTWALVIMNKDFNNKF